MKTIISALVLMLAADSLLAQQDTPLPVANQIPDCPKLGQPLQSIPEIVSKNGVLTGSLYTASEQQAFPVRPPVREAKPKDPKKPINRSPNPGTVPLTCSPQWVRVYRPTAPDPNPPNTKLTYPMPGPTLRARVGDLVQLRFYNQIDESKFQRAVDEQCDKTSTYPPAGETYPDCFSESVITNVHYHGTHTSPNSLADNVFLYIKHSPRVKGTNAIVINEATVEKAMDDVFERCAQMLDDPTRPQQWPTYWSDMPQSFRDQQKALLLEHARDWWTANQKLIDAGQFPQRFIAAYPYCFRLPKYTKTTWTPATAVEAKGAHTHGAGFESVIEAQQPNRPLIMGQVPGTHWYHAHKHGSTTMNVMNGMTGVFIIEGQYDDDINAYYGKDWTRSQKLLVIQQLGATPKLETSGQGTESDADFSVNGQFQPLITMKGGEVQMWRIANTSARAGVFFEKPPDKFEWRQLAQDGVQFKDTNYQNSAKRPSILLASGNRADILIKAPAYVDGGKNRYDLLVYNTIDALDRPPRTPTAKKLVLVTIEVTKPTGPEMQFMPKAPSFPPYLPDIVDSEITGTQLLTFSSSNTGTATSPTQHKINGLKFDGSVGPSVTLNQVQEWKVVNATFRPISHPFHIHINPFQISEIFDPNELLPGTKNARYIIKGHSVRKDGQCELDPIDQTTWKPCHQTVPKNNRIWRDVFSIPSGANLPAPQGKTVAVPGYFKMRSRFVDYSGQFVLHCHILAHEDRGMMTVVYVVPLQTPLSHH
ncbi:MAG TPA: multicopper oxidase domain-containing protein [Thermoanaerobaculia bacterium]